MRWGMPLSPKFGGPPVTNIRNTASPYWRGWLKPESRCFVSDLSPKVHPARGGILFSFEPVWLGDATGRDAEPSTQRSVPSCCIADAVSLA